MIATVPGYWLESDTAVAAGTKTGATKACDTTNPDPEQFEVRLENMLTFFPGDSEHNLNPHNPVFNFTYQGYNFDISPVLICKKPLKTVGLGDAISASGLVFSKYVHSGR